MRRYIFALIAAAAVAGLCRAGYSDDTDHAGSVLTASLNGFNEVPPILSGGTGTLRLKPDPQGTSIDYQLTYTSGFSSAVTQSHIHFAKVHVAGGIIIFLCTNLGNGPAGTPTCPSAPGQVSGTLVPAGVVGPTAQNIPPGDFAGLLAALASNTAYANIHTVNFPAGEIRGQIRSPEEEQEEHHHHN